MNRQHKIAILKYTTKNFWLLLIPLVRGLIAMGFDFYNWLQGAYLDIIVILLIIGLAVLRWRYIRYEVREEGIFLNTAYGCEVNFWYRIGLYPARRQKDLCG